MDPNLLPKNLRDREMIEKSKSEKISRSSDISFSNPNKFGAKNNFSKPVKEGFFKRIFGSTKKSKSSDSSDLTSPNSFGKNTKNKALNSNLLKKSKKTNGFLKNILGEPVSPLLINSNKNKEKEKPKPKEDREFNFLDNDLKEIAPIKIDNDFDNKKPLVEVKKVEVKKVEKKQKKDGWLSIIGGMFKSSKKNKVDIKLVDEEKNKIDLKTIEANKEKEKEKEKEKPKPKEDREFNFLDNDLKEIAPIKVDNDFDNKKPLVEVKKAEVEKVEKKQKKVNKFIKKSDFSNLGINLMPKNLISNKKNSLSFEIWFFIIIFLLSILFILIFYSVLFYLNQRVKADVVYHQAEFNNLGIKIGDFVLKEKDNNKLAERIELIKKTHNNQIIWSNFFDLLEKYTLDGVYFTSLSADTSGVLVLPGVADNYNVLAKQLALLNNANDFIKEAKLSNAQLYTEGRAGVIGVSFQIRLMLQDNIFKKL